jgi:hypothetical protein
MNTLYGNGGFGDSAPSTYAGGGGGGYGGGGCGGSNTLYSTGGGGGGGNYYPNGVTGSINPSSTDNTNSYSANPPANTSDSDYQYYITVLNPNNGTSDPTNNPGWSGTGANMGAITEIGKNGLMVVTFS